MFWAVMLYSLCVITGVLEAVCSFKAFVTPCMTTWHHNPQDHNQNVHCHENFKSYTYYAHFEIQNFSYEAAQFTVILE
jgi:hypothetical protein